MAQSSENILVAVPWDVLHDLWCYGNLRPVEGVVYGKTHKARLYEVEELLSSSRGKSSTDEQTLEPKEGA